MVSLPSQTLYLIRNYVVGVMCKIQDNNASNGPQKEWKEFKEATGSIAYMV